MLKVEWHSLDEQISLCQNFKWVPFDQKLFKSDCILCEIFYVSHNRFCMKGMQRLNFMWISHAYVHEKFCECNFHEVVGRCDENSKINACPLKIAFEIMQRMQRLLLQAPLYLDQFGYVWLIISTMRFTNDDYSHFVR